MQNLKKISLIILIIGYLIAGANHFINPASYHHIIPAYIPLPVVVNIAAGGFEILFALLLIPAQTRPLAAWGIILMLIAFLPVHVSMLSNAPLMVGHTLVTPTLAWLRLLFQPVLMLWAWWHSREW